MKTTRSRMLLVILLAVLLGACGSRQVAEERREQGSASLKVENRSWADMRVYVVLTGQRMRLGTVSGGATAMLVLPSHVVSGGRDLQFEVDPLGSRSRATSYSIFVRPGETVTLMIPSQVR